jgi:hypothetical protein
MSKEFTRRVLLIDRLRREGAIDDSVMAAWKKKRAQELRNTPLDMGDVGLPTTQDYFNSSKPIIRTGQLVYHTSPNQNKEIKTHGKK